MSVQMDTNKNPTDIPDLARGNKSAPSTKATHARDLWDIWVKQLMSYDEPFMSDRNQPKSSQERAPLEN